MEQIKIYNKDGNVSGEMTTPVFLQTKWNASLVHQVYKAITANLRRPTAHTKDRSEVSGGGKKPWRQKGTGRARQGSIRSPLWKGGGVSFGPRNTTIYTQKINKSMLRKALLSILSKKASVTLLKIVDSLSVPEPKTKLMAKIVSSLAGAKSALLVISSKEKNAVRAAKNLNRITIVNPKNLGLYDVMNHKNILIDKKAIEEMIKYYE